jgi:hypothetical protein
MGWATVWVIFFTKTSGHPGSSSSERFQRKVDFIDGGNQNQLSAV